MTDFLLELRSEEIPARMQAGARADLEKLFRRELQAAGVVPGEIVVWSTPRRLALMATNLPETTEAVREETRGPRTSAPPQALEGFLRKTGLTQDRLEDRDGTWFAVVEKPGRAVGDVLAEAIPAVVRAFPWPKSMRWGVASRSTESTRWVRPLSGIVAIFGEELVEFAIDGIESGFATLGHRFHCPGPITIGTAADYREKLRACHVIVDHEERQDLIREAAARAAAEAGLALVEDEGLVIENAGLTEWPVPLLGRFDEAFLEVPPEVIQLTARVNQKYFVCQGPPLKGEGDHAKHGGGVSPYRERDTPPSAAAPLPPPLAGEDRLANAFVCTANIEATDGGAAIVDGNRKVLAARLSDARFFWDQDRKTPLAEHAKKLERITFHEKLGTVADKVERVAKLARWLIEQDIVTPGLIRGPASSGAALENSGTPASAGVTKEELADLADKAAYLCKADLVTEMVGEFPELQGLMGGYYARAEGLPAEVADAIRDHYKPVGQGDEVPTAPVTVAVSLADKLDTLFAFFDINEFPTGSKDPYALRRAAIAIIRLILANDLKLHTDAPIEKWLGQEDVKKTLSDIDLERRKLLSSVPDFLLDRLAVQQREQGIRHDFVAASQRWGTRKDGRVDRVVKRAEALQNFIATEDGANLHAAYKRAANILKKEGWDEKPSPLQGRGLGEGHGAPSANDPRPPAPSPSGEGEIPETGEEDPLAQVDDPDLAPVNAARMADRREKQPSYTPEPAEEALIEALDSAEPLAARAVAEENFEAAMAALATLRAPIDRFFDEVTVNDENPEKRTARLDLLARFRAAVHEVADFSKIEG